ncbi:unnamed protein product [Calypogeia fissa]
MATVTASTMQSATLSSQMAVVSGVAAPRSSGLSLVRLPKSVKSQCLRHANVAYGNRSDSRRQFVVSAEYRRGGGAGDFVAGFLLGGVIFGAIGYLIAPVVNKTIAAVEKETQDDEEVEGPPKKLPKYVEDEEGLEQSTRKSLNEKIAQLNAAIDNVSAQLRAEDVNESAVELESAA